MKRVALIILTILCMAPVFNAGAQEYTQTPVTVSKEKIRDSDGKVYYSHVVQERQTLFSIAKAYGVTVDEICDANKDLQLKELGLKKNSIIRIPVSSAQTVSAAENKTVVETVAQKANDAKDKVVTHVVKWYEDIDDIAQKYKVSVEDILKENNLKSSKLKSRQELKIPTGKASESASTSEVAAAVEEPAVAEEVAETPKEESSILEDFLSIFTKKSTVDAVLLMPLNAGGTPSGNNMDFYCGALMAVRDLGDKGISTNLSVYDVANGALPVTAAKLAESDVIIGPVSTADLTKVINLNTAGTPIVSPLDQKAESLVAGHANFIQSPTSYDEQYEDIAKWIKSDLRNGDKVIVISENGAKDNSFKTKISADLNAVGVSFSPYSYSILQGRNVANALSGMLGSGTNRFVIASDSEAFVNDVVRNLNQLAFRKNNVVLYSSARIRSFNTIDVENFHALNLHASVSYYIDYDDVKVRDFLMDYRALYGTEPSRFAFQGYDITYFFIESCSEYGNKWLKNLASRKSESLLQSDFMFAEEEDGGHVNQGIRRIIYQSDYSVKLVK